MGLSRGVRSRNVRTPNGVNANMPWCGPSHHTISTRQHDQPRPRGTSGRGVEQSRSGKPTSRNQRIGTSRCFRVRRVLRGHEAIVKRLLKFGVTRFAWPRFLEIQRKEFHLMRRFGVFLRWTRFPMRSRRHFDKFEVRGHVACPSFSGIAPRDYASVFHGSGDAACLSDKF